jgi:hypothetical protein
VPRKKTVWVLWARSWNRGTTNLCRVTSKKVYQKYVELMKQQLQRNEKYGFASAEGLPAYYQESTDKAALQTMRDLAQPLQKGK